VLRDLHRLGTSCTCPGRKRDADRREEAGSRVGPVHGYAVARCFAGPRWLAVAPNGAVFVADSIAGEVIVLRGRGPSAGGGEESRVVFADHLNLPFGIAFHGNYVYIADTNEVLRFRYDPGSAKRLGDAEHRVDAPGGVGTYNESFRFSGDGMRNFSCDVHVQFLEPGRF
jgi:glucose/arabinose dehydrogenase